jgi:hypothetical protein
MSTELATDGLVLRVILRLTDPNPVLADSPAAAKTTAELIDALSKLDQSLGGEGLTLSDTQSLPGRLVLSLTPVQPIGAEDRFKMIVGIPLCEGQ